MVRVKKDFSVYRTEKITYMCLCVYRGIKERFNAQLYRTNLSFICRKMCIVLVININTKRVHLFKIGLPI